MLNFILFDGKARNNLLPFTYMRPVADIRIGILTIREKWEKLLNSKTSTLTKSYLKAKFPLVNKSDDILINASYLPTPKLAMMATQLKDDQAIYYNGEIVAVHISDRQERVNAKQYEAITYRGELLQINNVWDIFRRNKEALESDFQLLTKGRTSAPIPEYVRAKQPQNIFIEDTAEVNICTLNASEGPIYIGHHSIIMEGCTLRGGFALCDHAVLKMGAKIYGSTTIGPYCKVGGEVNNSVIFGYTNKVHDGYLGNSVIGEWCNLGADSNVSNLKNNYAEVRLWSYETNSFVKTGLQFCGLMMGDHSKCGINTMFNTGTVVGVSANIFGSNFPRNFIPSFSWGGAAGFSTYQMAKAKEVAEVIMLRRGIQFDETEENILQHVFEATKKYRGKK